MKIRFQPRGNTYIHTYAPAYTHTFTCVHVYLVTYIRICTRRHVYTIHVYIHVCVYTYIHTWRQSGDMEIPMMPKEIPTQEHEICENETDMQLTKGLIFFFFSFH